MWHAHSCPNTSVGPYGPMFGLRPRACIFFSCMYFCVLSCISMYFFADFRVSLCMFAHFRIFSYISQYSLRDGHTGRLKAPRSRHIKNICSCITNALRNLARALYQHRKILYSVNTVWGISKSGWSLEAQSARRLSGIITTATNEDRCIIM